MTDPQFNHIFGPVPSRRLGISLGIDIIPFKTCTFNCIYCECGWTIEPDSKRKLLPKRREVYEALDQKLDELKKNNKPPDVITFAGNGEPTLHPDFPAIVDDCIELRNKYFPGTRIAVLSNSSTITRPGIKEALLKVDQNILKLDSGFDLTVKIHNQPMVNIEVDELVKNLESGKVRGACLDVLEYEKLSFENLQTERIPPAFSKLIKMENVILSPHIAGWTHESHLKMAEVIFNKIKSLDID